MHYAQPALPWCQLPAVYSNIRSDVLAGNGGGVVAEYRETTCRFLFHAKDYPAHTLRWNSIVLQLPIGFAIILPLAD
jgi:hypothetical protein